MKPRERFLSACRRQAVDRAPAWMMRQAGRYLPEYRELRSGTTFMKMVRDPEASAEVTLQPIRRYGMDAAVIFSDILVPAAAMGMDVEVIEGTGPQLAPAIRSLADVDRLNDFDPNEGTKFLGDAIRLVRQELGDERAILGFCGAPFTLASYAVEGKSSRNFENTKAMMLGEPETFDRLLTRIVDNSIPYLGMQVEAGADALQVFDSWGGYLDATTYRERLLPHVARLVQGARGFDVPVILYVNGCSHLVDVLLDAEPDVLSVDWRIEPEEAVRRVDGRVALQGNLDPATLFAPPEVVAREARRVANGFKDAAGHVFNLGSGILPKAPLPSVQALWDVVLSESGGRES